MDKIKINFDKFTRFNGILQASVFMLLLLLSRICKVSKQLNLFKLSSQTRIKLIFTVCINHSMIDFAVNIKHFLLITTAFYVVVCF